MNEKELKELKKVVKEALSEVIGEGCKMITIAIIVLVGIIVAGYLIWWYVFA